MAIYHLSVKTIGRSEGRSATAAAAYRAADKITDERTGEIHDYTRKGGVSHTEILLPDNAPTWATNRAELWNAAEQSETRKNSTVAREFEIALPSELSEKERQRLAVDFAKEIVERHKVAADVAIHEPSRGGDNKNHHAHILITTRQLTEDGFTKKTRELDDRKSGEIDRWRERFAELQNERLKKNGVAETVDYRTLKAQGIDREPTKHLGVEATNYERRTGNKSNKRLDFEQQAAERLKVATEIKQLEREKQQIQHTIINLEKEAQAEVKTIVESHNKQAADREARRQQQEQARQIEQKKPSFGIEDKGTKLETKLNSSSAAKDLIKTAQERGWDTIKITGTPEFSREVWMEAQIHGIETIGYEPTAIDTAALRLAKMPAMPTAEPEKSKEILEKQEQHAEQALINLEDQLRETWRKKEHEILQNEAKKHRERHKELSAKEPKSLWRGKDHEAWVLGTNRIRQELIDTLEAAKNALEGNSAKERGLQAQFKQVARESLKKLYPELDQVLTNKVEREQQALEAQRLERTREQEQKSKQKSRDWDMEL